MPLYAVVPAHYHVQSYSVDQSQDPAAHPLPVQRHKVNRQDPPAQKLRRGRDVRRAAVPRRLPAKLSDVTLEVKEGEERGVVLH